MLAFGPVNGLKKFELLEPPQASTSDGAGRVRGRIQLAAAVIAGAAGYGRLMTVAEERRDVALAVIEIGAHQHVEIALATIESGSRGRNRVELAHQGLYVRYRRCRADTRHTRRRPGIPGSSSSG